MQENSISVNTISKHGALISDKTQPANLNKNQLQNNTSQPLLHGHSELQSQGVTHTKRKPLRLYQSKNRQSGNSIETGSSSIALGGVNPTATVQTQLHNSNVSNVRLPAPAFHNKSTNAHGKNVTQISPKIRTPLNTLQARGTASSPMPKSPLRLQKLEMEHLSESIKQTRLKQMQNQRQMQNDQRSQASNAQRPLSNVPQHAVQSPLRNPVQRQLNKNAVQQKQQQSPTTSQLQKQQQTSTTPQLQHKHSAGSQKSQYEQQLPHTSPKQNMHSAMEIESPDSPPECEKGQANQSHASQTDSENSSTESIAYLQKMIDNPSNTVVQQQIQGNTAKMLVMLSNGEQRLITFDIPNEDCTVQDLLEQANITFCGTTSVSLVSDPALGINYIVEAGPGTVVSSLSASDNSDGNNCQEGLDSSFDNSSQTISSPDENSNSTQQNEIFYKKNNERNSTAKLEKPERDSSVYKRGRGRGRGGRSKSRPIHKEPECLTISSDEEEDSKNGKIDNANCSASSADASNNFSEEMETILEKEPIITNNSVCSASPDYAADSEDNIKDNSVETPNTALLCRTVRIGSYKYIPREKVVISQNGVRFSVPLLEDDKSFVTLDVKLQDMVKVLIHFGKSMPVLFFYTTTSTGAMIRELLGMQDPKGPYYDPAGKDHTHKRITLLPEELTEGSKIVLKSLFVRKHLLEELNSKEANDILVRASPKDSLQIQSLNRRESQSASSSNSNVNGGIQTITVYPPPPAKGGIAINTEDYLCLGEDQFLNDVIIDFYLKYLTLEVLSECDQHRTHVFSSYFYKRLTSPHAQAAESTVPLSAAAKRHARVQKWTKNVNIFEKEFVIIPINEHAHWFLAIICFPGLVGKVATSPRITKGNDVHKTVQKSKKLKELKVQALTIGNTTITPVTTTITIDQADDGSERDEAEGDDEEMEMDSDEDEETETSEENKKVDQAALQDKETVKVPCILIFDSLAGASRSRVVATLRDYLSCEHVAKMGSEKEFSKDTIKGSSLKVPQQSNFTDCGLYVLQYVESFFKSPIKDYTLPIKTLKNWFEEIIVTRKREELSKLLIKLMNTTKGDKNINLPVVNFPTQNGKLKVKAENNAEMKPVKADVENKKKPTVDGENRISNSIPNSVENTESNNELVTGTTYQLIPYSPCTSSNSSESNTTEMLTEPKTPLPRSSSETMSYLKAKRIIPRLIRSQEDSQAAKKHKGESFDSCK